MKRPHWRSGWCCFANGHDLTGKLHSKQPCLWPEISAAVTLVGEGSLRSEWWEWQILGTTPSARKLVIIDTWLGHLYLQCEGSIAEERGEIPQEPEERACVEYCLSLMMCLLHSRAQAAVITCMGFRHRGIHQYPVMEEVGLIDSHLPLRLYTHQKSGSHRKIVAVPMEENPFLRLCKQS